MVNVIAWHGQARRPAHAGLVLGWLVAHAAIQEGHILCPGAGLIGAERRSGGAAGNIILHGPQHRVGVVGVCRNIRKGIGGASRRLALIAPQEGDDLGAVADHVRAEGGGAGTLGNTGLYRPLYGLLVEAALDHIRKGHLAARGSGASGGPPQEGDGLGPGAGFIGAEGGGGSTAGNAVVHSPQHGVIIEGAGLHIHEGICDRLRNLCKDGLDRDLRGGHGEAVLAAAQILHGDGAAGTSDRQGLQLVALIRHDGQGDGIAHNCGIAVSGDAAVGSTFHGDGVGDDRLRIRDLHIGVCLVPGICHIRILRKIAAVRGAPPIGGRQGRLHAQRCRDFGRFGQRPGSHMAAGDGCGNV